MASRESKDRNGILVTEGSTVRLLAFEEGTFTSMPEDEIPLVQSMLGEVFVVEEIDEHGLAWVWKSWPTGDGTCRTHGVGLEPHEMELITDAG